MRKIITTWSLFLLGACSAGDVPESNAVRIVRDGYGVPHIYADTVYGLYYGYGYAIGEDRLFQMEMSRRTTSSMTRRPGHFSARTR